MRISSDFRDLLYELTAVRVRFLVVGAYVALERFGAPVDNLSVQDLCEPEIVFQIGVEPVRIDLLTTIPGLGFATADKNAVKATYEDVEVRLLSIRDILRAKRAAGRPQDLIDAARLEKALRHLQAGTTKGASRARLSDKTRKLKRRDPRTYPSRAEAVDPFRRCPCVRRAPGTSFSAG